MKIPEVITKNLPTILSAVAVIGVAATAVLTAKATPKALKALKDAEEEKHDTLTSFEKVQVAAPSYIFAAAAGVATTVCIISSNRISMKQIAALGAACTLLKTQYKKYRDKVTDILGFDAELKVREAMSHDEHPVPDVDRSEERLFRINDGTEDRYFWSTMEKVLMAEYEINRNIATSGEASLSDFYYNLGIEDKNDSEHFGWSIDMLCDWYGFQWLDFDNRMYESDEPDKPDVIEITFFEPAVGYQNGEWEDWFTHKDFTTEQVTA